MPPEIRTAPIRYTIAGVSLRHDPAKRYSEEIMTLLGRLWPILKNNNITHDGINRVVYDADATVFAGVILDPAAEGLPAAASLERKPITLSKYAYWKHVGPYHQLPAIGSAMMKAIQAMGLRAGSPMVEVYGHWTSDEAKLETETYVAIV